AVPCPDVIRMTIFTIDETLVFGPVQKRVARQAGFPVRYTLRVRSKGSADTQPDALIVPDLGELRPESGALNGNAASAHQAPNASEDPQPQVLFAVPPGSSNQDKTECDNQQQLRDAR